jgi:hypothetical protein
VVCPRGTWFICSFIPPPYTLEIQRSSDPLFSENNSVTGQRPQTGRGPGPIQKFNTK